MFKNFLITLGGVVLLLIVSFAFSLRVDHTNDSLNDASDITDTTSTMPETEMSRYNRTLHIGTTTLQVEIADTSASRSQGLSDRDPLPENTGMLFVFDKPDMQAFWMKDMRFALDMIWIDADNRVIGITHDISPATYNATFPSQSEIFSSPALVQYVLEVSAGFSRSHGIKEGDQVVLETN